MEGGVGLDARKIPWGLSNKSQPWALGSSQFTFHFYCKNQLSTTKESLLSSLKGLADSLSEIAGCGHPVSKYLNQRSITNSNPLAGILLDE